MKKYLVNKTKIVFFIIISFSCVYSCFSQSKLKGLGHYSNNTLCLRWAVDDYDTYILLKEYGFNLERQTIINNTDTLNFSEQDESTVILAQGSKPKSAQWIQDTLPDNDFTLLLSKLLYSNESDSVINFNSPKLIDAVNLSNQNKAKLFAIQYASEQNFNIAMAAALGDIDVTAAPNMEYRYIISIKDSLGKHMVEPLYIIQSTFQNNSFGIVDKPSSKGVPGGIEIYWFKTPQTKYVGYNIYRSTDGINYTKVNDVPFVYFKSSEIESNEISYIDSTGFNETYTYRVTGITPFGTQTEPSDTTTSTSLFPKISNYDITIEKVVPSMTEVPLEWAADSLSNNLIEGFNIFRSETIDGSYTKLNSSIIVASDRSFIDLDPISVGYYYVEALDFNGYAYYSNPKMVYLPDSIPPLAPIGLNAEYFGVSRVELDWTANSESDLAGYRVEMSNHAQGPFVQITETFIESNDFVFYTDSTIVSDSIYFRVFAQDKRGNYSTKSAHFGCKRPDIVPPASPGLNKIMPTRTGIELNWEYSPTKSVIRHILERKLTGTPSWVTILTIENQDKELYSPSDSTSYNYIDTQVLEQRSYEYRLIAEEPGNIRSSSKMISVTPLPTVVSSNLITNFKIDVEIEQGSPNRIIQEQIANLKKVKSNSRFSSGSNNKHNIRLNWTFNLDPNLKDFQILRAISGANLVVYRTISITEALGLDPLTEEAIVDEDMGPTDFTVLDKDLLTGRRYTYQIIGRYKDQSSTPRSIALTKRIDQN